MDIKPLINEDFLSVQKDQTLSSLIGKLILSKKRDALIFNQEEFLGIVEDKWFLRARLDASEVKIANYVKQIPTAAPETDLLEAACLMFQSDIASLPVASNKKILGVVSGLDLIKEAAKLEQLKNLTVDHLKITRLPELKAKDPISTALTLMFRKKIEHIPVVENGQLTGVISYRDILKKHYPLPARREHAWKRGYAFKDARKGTRAFEPDRPEIDRLPIDSFDTHYNLQTITEKDKITDAINLLYEKNITALVVLRNGKPWGMLSLKNILRKIASLKIPKNFNIRFIGLNEANLDPYQKQNVEKIASVEASKLQRKIHNQFDLVIHIKAYAKEGKGSQQKYAVNLRVNYPGRTIESHRGWGGTWDIETALRKAFRNASNELKAKFRGDSAWRKPYE